MRSDKKSEFHFIKVSLVLLIICSSKAFGFVENVEIYQKISEHPQWRKLLHYKDSKPLSSSRINKKTFFLSVENNPKEEFTVDASQELIDFVAYYKEPSLSFKVFNRPIQCVFPARAYWLSKNFSKELRMKPFELNECPLVKVFIEDMGPEQLSYIFVGPYISNPASIMGHSFLLFKKPTRTTILNHAISYAAHVPDQIDPLTYMRKGLLGGFYGAVRTEPFFNKLTEYRKIENRTMWDITLNLRPDELKLLALHIYELKDKDLFYYYFLDENCSYLLAVLIDLIRPDLEILEGLDLFVLPSRIPELLNDKGLIKKREFYAPFNEEILKRYVKLNERQKEFFKTHFNSQNFDVSNLNSQDLINLFLLNLNQKSTRTGGVLKGEKKILFEKLIEQRLKLPPSTAHQVQSLIKNKENSIENTHPMFFSALYWGKENTWTPTNREFLELRFRPFIHSLVEPDIGYVAYSELTFFSPEIRIFKNGDPVLQRLNLVNFTQIPKDYPFDRLASFKYEAFLENKLFSTCDSCLGTGVNLGYGLSRDFFSRVVSLYAHARLSQSMNLYEGLDYHYALGPEVGVIIKLSDNFKFSGFYAAQFNEVTALGFHKTKLTSNLQINPYNAIFMSFEQTQFFNNERIIHNKESHFKFGYHYYF